MTRVIAICGIDGAGKSTLFRRLQESGSFPGEYISKSDRTSVELLTRFGPQAGSPLRNWFQGSFARVAAIAATFDFLRHFELRVQPRIDRAKALICDRYSVCYGAYASAVTEDWRGIEMLERIRPADLVIYLDLPAELAALRYIERGGAGEDESVAVMKRFRVGYEHVLRHVSSKVVRIDASLARDIVYEQALKAMESVGEQY